MAQKKGGWFRESQRHSLASKGIKTGIKQEQKLPRRVRKLRTVGHSFEQPREGLIFVDSQTGEMLIFLREEHHPVTGDVVNVIFQDEDGDERADRDYSEVHLLSTSANVQLIGKQSVRLMNEIKAYREDSIMFTYVRLDKEINELENSLEVGGPRVKWVLNREERDEAKKLARRLRKELESSEAPWTDAEDDAED
jgi:hypothetical protein